MYKNLKQLQFQNQLMKSPQKNLNLTKKKFKLSLLILLQIKNLVQTVIIKIIIIGIEILKRILFQKQHMLSMMNLIISKNNLLELKDKNLYCRRHIILNPWYILIITIKLSFKKPNNFKVNIENNLKFKEQLNLFRTLNYFIRRTSISFKQENN